MDGLSAAQLMDIAERIPDGPERSRVLEEAVRLCDLSGDDHQGYYARSELVQSTVFSGEIEKAIVAFTWCIAKYDLGEEYVVDDVRNLMWEYRWIVASIASFPFMPVDRVHSMEDDIVKRFEDVGFGTKSLYIHRWHNARSMGHIDRMIRARESWLQQSYDFEIECKACDLQAEVSFSIHDGDFGRAESRAKSLLKSRDTCNRVPLTTLVEQLEPLRREGRIREAETLAEEAVTHLTTSSETFFNAAALVRHFLETERYSLARTIVDSHLRLALKTQELDSRLEFLHAARLFIRSTGEDLRVADSTTGSVISQEWLAHECSELSGAFDSRNGNTALSDRLSAHEFA